MDISGSVIDDLKVWLLSHEADIAYSNDDFGSLYHVFVVFIGRDPKA